MRYVVKTYSNTQQIGRLNIDAPNSAAAQLAAQAQGYSVLSVRPSSRWGIDAFRSKRKFAVLLFCQELLALLDAGMGLVESIEILQSKTREGHASQVLAEVYRFLREGRTFSAALEQQPAAFPTLLVATMRSAERTGDLPQALRRYLSYQRQLTAVRDKVVAASVYPTLLLLVGMVVVFFLLVYVVPRFSKVYEDVGQDRLPALSRWLMQWGLVVNTHLNWLLLGLAAIGALAIYAFSRPALRGALGQYMWRLPRIGEQLRVYQLAQFTRTVAMLLKGGIPLVQTLGMATELLRQPALAAGLGAARQAIAEGRTASDAFRENGLATEVGVRLLVVGERSGELGETMERIAAFYDDEIARTVDWFSRLFEPILMIFIGLLIGGIVVLMYLPIFELAGAIQ